MSGAVNPAFEENELEALENGQRKWSKANEKEETDTGEFPGCLARARKALEAYLSRYRRVFRTFGLLLVNLLVLVYLGFASAYWDKNSRNCEIDWCDGYGMLLLIVGFTYFGLFYYCIGKKYFGKSVVRCCRPITNCFGKLQDSRRSVCVSKTIVYLSMLVAVIIFLIVDTAESRDRLISALGIVTLVLLGWIFSKHPGHIDWRPVIWGLVLQFTLGLFIIRWSVGRSIFQCVSDKVVTFLNYAKSGATFMFSEAIVKNGVFAFTVLPVIFFFSFCIQILYYLGAMQWVIMKLGWLLQMIMGTTLCESLICSANPFLGMTETPILIKPYISRLTSSELHTVMTSGFATVSGTVFAAYIEFGAQPIHLLTASAMAAPAALCYSKLFYPETENSVTRFDNIQLEKSQDTGILDAATKGAIAAIPVVLGIIANIVAFVSFIAFINGLLSWCGGLVGYEELSFELILSKIFMPLSWIMGVPWDECEDVATLIGLKTIVNEFVAYQKLGEYKKQERLGARAEVIATYALCGFSNPGSIGILVGGLSALAPEKREQITGVTVRAFIAGSAVSFLTASIAGVLTNDVPTNMTMPNSNSTTLMTTIIS